MASKPHVRVEDFLLGFHTTRMMNLHQIQARIEQHQRAARMAKRPCYVPGCGVPAIWSHLLQNNGMISELADATGRVVDITQEQLFRARRPGDNLTQYYFARTHKNQVLTFLAFCNAHDTQLFSSIETPGASIVTGSAPLLLSYRAFLYELQKQENNYVIWSRVDGDQELVAAMEVHEPARLRQMRYLLSTSCYTAALARRTKQHLEAALGLGPGPTPGARPPVFESLCFDMERVPICTSASFGYVEIPQDVLRRIDRGEDPRFDGATFFVTIAPTPAAHTTVVLGSLSTEAVTYGPLVNEYQKRALVSDLILRQFETWVISCDWYDHYIKPHERRVLSERLRMIRGRDKLLTATSFNIFKLNSLAGVNFPRSLLDGRARFEHW